MTTTDPRTLTGGKGWGAWEYVGSQVVPPSCVTFTANAKDVTYA